MSDNYKPFGDEWKAEMMKWKKENLVDYLREILVETKKLQIEKVGQEQTQVMPKIAIEIKDAIENYYDLVMNTLECECDEYEGVTCGIHTHRSIAELAKEKLSNFTA